MLEECPGASRVTFGRELGKKWSNSGRSVFIECLGPRSEQFLILFYGPLVLTVLQDPLDCENVDLGKMVEKGNMAKRGQLGQTQQNRSDREVGEMSCMPPPGEKA